MRKVIQICGGEIGIEGQAERPVLFALTEDGEIWMKGFDENGFAEIWVQVAPLPDKPKWLPTRIDP